MSDGVEKRRFARTEISAAVQYRTADGEAPRDGWLGNVSSGGILLWTEDKLSVGITLYLRINADELGDAEVEVTATIVRIDPARRDGQFGYGCRFDAFYSGPPADTD
ncbi:MAG: PilZ domain-containing protein [Candidatus Contendobacter sp.]